MRNLFPAVAATERLLSNPDLVAEKAGKVAGVKLVVHEIKKLLNV